MIDGIDPINQAECGGGKTIEDAGVFVDGLPVREIRRRLACFDELVAACEMAHKLLDHPILRENSSNTFAALAAAIARAKGGAQ